MDDSLQPTIDMLLNLSVFLWFGAVCPWSSFLHNNVIPIYRLVFLGILILLFRRLPIVIAMHKGIHQIEQLSQAAFVGFFGPIGVGAIFYLSVARQYLLSVTVDGKMRADAQQVSDTVNVVVWFLVICSIVRVETLPWVLGERFVLIYLIRWSMDFQCRWARPDITCLEQSPAP